VRQECDPARRFDVVSIVTTARISQANQQMHTLCKGEVLDPGKPDSVVRDLDSET
jgi:hypothetical protein